MINLIYTSLEKHNDIASHSLNDQWCHLILALLIRLDNSFHQSRLLIVIDALGVAFSKAIIIGHQKICSALSFPTYKIINPRSIKEAYP